MGSYVAAGNLDREWKRKGRLRQGNKQRSNGVSSEHTNSETFEGYPSGDVQKTNSQMERSLENNNI